MPRKPKFAETGKQVYLPESLADYLRDALESGRTAAELIEYMETPIDDGVPSPDQIALADAQPDRAPIVSPLADAEQIKQVLADVLDKKITEQLVRVNRDLQVAVSFRALQLAEYMKSTTGSDESLPEIRTRSTQAQYSLAKMTVRGDYDTEFLEILFPAQRIYLLAHVMRRVLNRSQWLPDFQREVLNTLMDALVERVDFLRSIEKDENVYSDED